MKNFVKGSNIIVDNGNIHIGDNIIHFHSFDEYKTLTLKKKDLEEKLQHTNDKFLLYCKKQESDKSETIYDFIQHLNNDIQHLNQQIEDTQKEISKFEDNLLSSIVLCFEDNSMYDFEEINNLLRLGQIDFINNKLVINEIRNRKNKLQQASSVINQNLHDISRAFLLKAKTVQLQTSNEDRYSDAYTAFRESIDSDKYAENLYEFASFLYDHKEFESIQIFKELLNNYRNNLSNKEILDVLDKLGFAQYTNRDYVDALSTYENRLVEAKRIETESKIISIENILDIFSCHKSIARTSQTLFKDALYIDSHFEACFSLLSSIRSEKDMYEDEYADLLGEYANFLAKQNKNNLEIPYKLLFERCTILHKSSSISTETKVRFAYALVDLSRIQTLLNTNHVLNAKSNLEDVSKILNDIDENTLYQNIALLILLHHGFSRIYLRLDKVNKSIEHMHTAIEFSKMKLNSSLQEGAEAAAVFSIELSDLYKSVQDYSNYYKHRQNSINWLREAQTQNPTKNFKNLAGTYEKLLLPMIDEASMPYLRELLAFYEYCKVYNPNSETLDFCIQLTKTRLGMVIQIFNKDYNKAKQIYLEVINSIGLDETSEKMSLPREIAFDMLILMKVYTIEVCGKTCTLIYNKNRHGRYPEFP